ncbi:NADH:flavin oxidoreductase [Mangrovibacillus cuniculi]|uniref:NADH:flavin oxidoreductase n=1 Tax=Mangrovibacillus cuniculi TaxID=2593652 RepID=A0A7S8HER0_9BACI|nr:NADH:flavin oxidoreductase [Mangrovibacillus cuniculi]QPC45650.1 NADH:flavin oxidoreductase [Mangrovibacillus cuniculi]
MKFQPLFESQQISQQTFSNRYIVAPMTRVSAESDGKANDRMKAYYERFAVGGFGAIISEGIYTDKHYSQGYRNQPGLASDMHVDAWKPVVEAVKAHGTKFIAQLMHGGAQSQGNAYTDETIAPSATAPKGEQLAFYGGSGPYKTPKAMETKDFEQVREGFVQAAIHAKDAGFDGVELHAANGYLLDEFLTEYMNLRDDEYGGSMEAGLGYVKEVADAVRLAVGESFIVGIRLSQGKVSDQEYRWPGGEQGAENFFNLVKELPLDYIHVTDADGTAPSFGEHSRSIARLAKEVVGLPVIANGKLGDPDKALKAVTEEKADFVSIGATALANPDTPNLVKAGKEQRAFDPTAILFPEAFVKDAELEIQLEKR